jgi:hypothetical protein
MVRPVQPNKARTVAMPAWHAPASSWPAAGTATVALPASGLAGAGRLPVRIGPLPKWIFLPPGPHDLHFQAGNSIQSSFFDERLTLNEGDVLVAVCEPSAETQEPEADLWSLGIIGSEGNVRPVRLARPSDWGTGTRG